MVVESWRGQFIRYLIGRGLSAVGTNLVLVILGFAVLSVGGDARAFGLVLACSVGAQALVLPASGMLADRVSRRLLVVVVQLVLATVQLLMGMLLLAASAAVWMFVVAATVTGAAGAAARPAFQGMLVELVPAVALQRANAGLRLVLNLARVAIPGSGALLGAAFGFGYVLVVAGLAFAVCGGVLATLPAGQLPQTVTRWWREARAGWSAFVSRTWLWVFVAQGAVAVPLWLAGYQLLGPVVVAERPAGLQFWGWAVSAFVGGMIAGSLVAMWWRPRRLMLAVVCCSLVWPLPLAVLALDVPLAWLLVAMLISGVGMDLSFVYYETARQQHIPAELIGRVSALAYLGEIVLVPAGYLLAGSVAVLVGNGPVLWFCFAGCSLTAAGLLLVRSIRTLARAEPTSDPPGRPIGQPGRLIGRPVGSGGSSLPTPVA